VDQTTTIGASTGTATGVLIRGTDPSTYGTLLVASGVTLTLKGVNTNFAPAMMIQRYAHFEPQPGSTIIIDPTGDYQTAIVNNGVLISTGTAQSRITYGTPSSDKTWSNTATNEISDTNRSLFDKNGSLLIYNLKLTFGPISNAAGTGIGSFGDSSVAINSVTPAGILTTAKSSYAGLIAQGDYYIDHGKGVLYYAVTSATTVGSLNRTYKYLTFNGAGIISTANTTYNSAVFDYSVFNFWGTKKGLHEYTGSTLQFNNKRSAAVDSTRQMWVKNSEFNYTARSIGINNSNGQAGDNIEVTGNTFNNTFDTTIGRG